MLAFVIYFILSMLVPATFFLRKKHARYPPSPPRHWLLGNLLDMPRTVDWDKLASWREEYGSLTYLTAFGKSVLILHTVEVIKDLFDKRATVYSHRPRTVMAGELFGLNKSIIFFDYNERYKAIKKLTQQALNPAMSKKYQTLQMDCVKLFLHQLLIDPDAFREQSRVTVSRMILMITYGVDIKSADSEYITDAQLSIEMATEAAMPGAYLVDMIPILKYLPRWVPFTHFHQVGDVGRNLLTRFVNRPFAHVERALSEGHAPASFVADTLGDRESMRKNGKHSEDMIEDIKWAAGSLFAAGVETTFATMLVIFLLMSLHPEVQKKAQQEIDSITGRLRMVTLEDRGNMPYLHALLQEVARWHVVIPTALPRRTAMADVYQGYTIPADTLVIPNIWALSQTVEDPHRFDPKRFLNGSNIPNPNEYVFGFGRRICPGRHVAENFLFLVAANVLQFFNISQPDKPVNNLRMPAETKFTPTLVSCPEPFACKITPRSEADREFLGGLRAE